MIALKEDKIADLKKSSTLLNKLKSNTNKLLSRLAREGTPLNSKTFWDSEKDTYLSLLLT